MSKWLNFDKLKEKIQCKYFTNVKYFLAFPLVLAACQYEPLPTVAVVEPKTPEEEKREQYYGILKFTNRVLYGDVVGYFDDSGEITRTRTRCKDRICSTGFTAFITPRAFSLENVDLDLQGTRNGVDVVVERGNNSNAGTVVYGGWLRYSFFASQFDKLKHPLNPYKGGKRVTGYALGYSAGENPSATDGSAKWVGLMFGRDVGDSSARGRALQGDAEITVDFDDESTLASVKLSNIEDIIVRTKYRDMEWRNLEIDQGSFSRHRAGTGNYISGQFFGPREQEVGGVFERDEVAGAFGGVRQ